ncbi:hypothetical protein MMC16_007528 [Acarospora aff. strigata]|nr:hypothetical protein [Acarospora aff. strigata]
MTGLEAVEAEARRKRTTTTTTTQGSDVLVVAPTPSLDPLPPAASIGPPTAPPPALAAPLLSSYEQKIRDISPPPSPTIIPSTLPLPNDPPTSMNRSSGHASSPTAKKKTGEEAREEKASRAARAATKGDEGREGSSEGGGSEAEETATPQPTGDSEVEEGKEETKEDVSQLLSG